jgi:hypothetical protein
MKMGCTRRPLGRCLLRGGGEVRVDLGKYQAVCHHGRRSSPEDGVAGSIPARLQRFVSGGHSRDAAGRDGYVRYASIDGIAESEVGR